MPYKRIGSPYLWASYIDASGERVRRSTGTADIEAAKAIEAKWRSQAYAQQHWDRKPPRTFEEVMVEYLGGSQHLRGMKVLRFQVMRLKEYFGGREVNKLTGLDVKHYIRWRQEAGRGSATINRELAALSSAINYCNREWEWDLPNPVKGRLLKEPPHRERYLTKAEAGRLITEARKRRNGDLLADFIEVAVNTGCRRGELFGLEWSRVDLAKGREAITLRSTHTKSGKPRTVPLNGPAIQAVKRRQASRAEHAPDTPWVFSREDGEQVKSLRQGFKASCEAAGIEDLRIHDLRHTAASWLVTDGVPLEVVKELLGHSSITMTERYAHLAPHRVREAVNRMGGMSQSSHTNDPVRRLDDLLEKKKAL